MAKFKLVSGFKPDGDQPQAIKALTENILKDKQFFGARSPC